MQIVAVQLSIAWENKPANHKRVRELLTDAQVQPGALVVLPEMFDTGFSMNPDATAQGEQRESEAFLKSLAEEFQCCVLGGVVSPIYQQDVPRDAAVPSGQVRNVAGNEAVAFGSDGTLLTRYRKMQPFSKSNEADHYPPGHKQASFEWQGVKISPFICYDLRFPEIFRPAAIAGAELIVVIACWPAIRSEHWVRLLQARAIENQCITIGVNRCGAEPGIAFDGRSCGFDEMGHPLFEADEEEQVVQFEIDASSVRAWREQFPALLDIR